MMADASIRQLLMLQKIPPHPRQITTKELQQYLADEGFEVSLRTIQRNLEALSAHLPLEADKRDTIYGWCFRKENIISLPGMDSATGLTLMMAEKHLKALLPPSILQNIQPFFNQAKGVLDKYANTPSKAAKRGNWPKKIGRAPQGIHPKPPKIPAAVLDTIYEAVLEEKTVLIQHRDKDKRQLIHPLGLALKGPLIYMVCSYWDFDTPRHVPLHRILSAEQADQRFKKPKGFNLNKYIESGAFGFKESDDLIDIKVRFYGRAIHHLMESPLNSSQVITEESDDTAILEATMADTSELKWWLLGFGDQVEVLKPAILRKEMADHSRNMLARYES